MKAGVVIAAVVTSGVAMSTSGKYRYGRRSRGRVGIFVTNHFIAK